MSSFDNFDQIKQIKEVPESVEEVKRKPKTKMVMESSTFQAPVEEQAQLD